MMRGGDLQGKNTGLKTRHYKKKTRTLEPEGLIG
jgi:hypothetical protein